MKKILVTGASGFIGSFIVEKALEKGFETWAAVRRNSSRRYLGDKRIKFIELDFGSEQKLTESLSAVQFDYIVHAAGVTKTPDTSMFYKVNTEGTRHFCNAVVATQEHLQRFVFISSLSIMGAIAEQQPYREIVDSDVPQPNTHYGRSKIAAEQVLDATARKAEEAGKRFDYVILRPTGVYGPREKDYMMMAQSIRNHVDFAVGYKPQDITFVYVRDVVQAIFLALDNGTTGSRYFLTDGKVYRSKDFSLLLKKALGVKWCMRIVAPIWLLRVITFFGDIYAKLTGNITALNSDKYHILRQRNWRCDISKAVEKLHYKPQYDLERGVNEMIGKQ